MLWRTSAAAILITGSISSTFGAEAGSACAAPPPASVKALFDRLAFAPEARVRYREEVRHPALPEPEIATGTMWVSQSGSLMRQQETPRRELSELDDRVLRIRATPGAEPVIYPVPERLRATITATRLLLLGAEALPADAVSAGTLPPMETGPNGWRVRLGPANGPNATVFGCGDRARGIETEDETGVHRTIRFLPLQ